MQYFLANSQLEQWVDEGVAVLDGDVLDVREHGRFSSMVSAVHVVSLVTGSDAQHKVLGRVYCDDELIAKGGQLYLDSLLIEEDAYDVVRGLLLAP
jgi:hypothetical protein